MATLTAPIRWLGHTVRGLTGLRPALPGRSVKGFAPESAIRRFRRFRRPPWPDWPGWPGEGGGSGGVREPRRPRGNPPAGAMALSEPSGQEPTDLTR
jgi:hypothetical protein